MAILYNFRALSGSQYVYFNSSQATPAGITNKVVVSEVITVDTVDTASILSASSPVLWKWNGVDVSQFEMPVLNSGQFATASFKPAATNDVISSSSGAIRLHVTWSGGGGAAMFALSASQWTIPSTNRFNVRMRVTTGSANLYQGMFVHNNVLTTAGLFGVGHGTATSADNGIRLDAKGSAGGFPPFNFPSATPGAPRGTQTDGTAPRGTVYEFEVILRQGSGSNPPGILLYAHAQGYPSVGAGPGFRSVETDFETSFNSGWGGVQLTNFGIFLRSAVIGNYFIEISELMILKHPFDR